MGYKNAQPINNHRFKRFRRKQWVTNKNTCADEYTCTIHGKVFPEPAGKGSISFHFGETWHYNNIYFGKIGSIESVTIEEFVPRKFVKHINNDRSQCLILLGYECHDKADAFVHYSYQKLQRNLVVLDIQGLVTVSVIQKLCKKRIKLTLRKTTFILVIFRKEQFWVSQKHMYASDFVEH